MIFCELCENITAIQMDNKKLERVCFTCQNKTPALPEDSLRYTENKSLATEMNRAYLKIIATDPINKQIMMDCGKCKKEVIGRLWRRQSDMALFHVCKSCFHIQPGYTVEDQ